jgi:hypothetical protein
MSFQYLIDTHIQPVNCIDEFSTWRRETLYTHEVNDVLFANEQNLKKVYDTGIKFKAQKRLHRKECIEIFTVEADVDIGEREATIAFALSKMTVPDENGEMFKYDDIQFVEFLEMVGRAADLKFKDSEQEELPLHKKIEFVIDDLLVLVPGAKRVEVSFDPEEETVSDTDY